jgi:hypothetical protein
MPAPLRTPMDALLSEWQSARLPAARPAQGPHRQAPRRSPLAGRMSRHQDEQVVIEAGQVTVKGTPEEVHELAVAAGLYPGRVHRRPMARDEDHIMTGVYIGLGVLLAAGAGYLAWRYVLDDAQKQRLVNTTKDLVADGVTAGKRAVRDARGKAGI